MRTRSWRSYVYFVAGLGLIVSLFAAAEFFDVALRNICSVSSFLSCAAVDQSGLTSTLGIPDYAWGIGGFVAILLVAAFAERNPDSRPWAWTLVGVTSIGVAVSFYLLYVELALIGALCIVCASAYLLGGASWVGAIVLLGRTRPARDDADDDEPDARDA
ncbi:MAG TPA: vitamin K epoxide reductase family protein [Thermoplasmata archaeon]|nr:vitamin K epoxide reductase family protein [Thermoplasmata archaeon]